MKLHFSKDWLRKKVETDDAFCEYLDECGVMAISPEIYARSKLNAKMYIADEEYQSPTWCTINWLMWLDGLESDYTDDGINRSMWRVKKALRSLDRYLARSQKSTS